MAPPVIDLGVGSTSEHARAIAAACEEWGFFQVVNHGVDRGLLADLDAATAEFFKQPSHVKALVKRDAQNPRGWFDDELTKQTRDFKEGFDFGEEGRFAVDGFNQWPSTPATFKEKCLRGFQATEQLGIRLASLMAIGLGLEANAFDKELQQGTTSFMRLNHYPACGPDVRAAPEDWAAEEEPDPLRDGVLSINKHTDAGVLTVLRQREGDPATLQVFSRRSGKFERLIPVPGAFIINVGDVMQVFSNDRFQSPIHRVLASDRERFSFPFFLNPTYSTVCEPRNVEKDDHPRYAPFTWGEFRRRRFEGDFSDVGKEAQISDYRKPSPDAPSSSSRL